MIILGADIATESDGDEGGPQTAGERLRAAFILKVGCIYACVCSLN